MAAYRMALRLFPGLHLPALGLGQEYCAMGSLGLAERALLQVGKKRGADREGAWVWGAGWAAV